jgi:transcriptional regulator with XRE-family HTH domain
VRNQAIYRVLGRRLRQRRRLLDLTQREVSDACGLTFQQIQKYESGMVALSVARLLRLAAVLRLPLAEIFEGLQVHAGAEDRPAIQALPASDGYLRGGPEDRSISA